MRRSEKIIEETIQEIPRKYRDSYRRKLADKALQVGLQWAGKQEKDSASKLTKKQLYNECYAFIKGKTKDEPKPYGSIIFTIVMYAIISWITQKILEYLFERFISEENK